MTRETEPEVQRLRDQALTCVGRSSGRTPIRTALYHLTRGRVDRRPRYSVGQLPTLETPWQDTVSGRYFGWRCRGANLDGRFAFVVEYIVCRTCQAAWVDKPYTAEEYQRKGLASTGLRALREENPGLRWFTGSGHVRDARAFWVSVGMGVPGGYEERELCEHIDRHGGVKPRWLLRRQRRHSTSDRRCRH
ncbi:hypothetical protein Q2K19_31965 [Micromonospora soli]|uniref:hypothetical protein n=1 Tax=Micromonospora sp. NBRC 110009 TaxID=3061627 RepID=UPI0026736B81|nr:hypothetical protein [Micromonospora sp. NBRC 110009]WKT98705.1 hypothetical protein Q2K19_31965 [Micromonospora sp. NBRC 110009]